MERGVNVHFLQQLWQRSHHHQHHHHSVVDPRVRSRHNRKDQEDFFPKATWYRSPSYQRCVVVIPRLTSSNDMDQYNAMVACDQKAACSTSCTHGESSGANQQEDQFEQLHLAESHFLKLYKIKVGKGSQPAEAGSGSCVGRRPQQRSLKQHYQARCCC